jgi:hypothetical protein
MRLPASLSATAGITSSPRSRVEMRAPGPCGALARVVGL